MPAQTSPVQQSAFEAQFAPGILHCAQEPLLHIPEQQSELVVQVISLHALHLPFVQVDLQPGYDLQESTPEHVML